MSQSNSISRGRSVSPTRKGRDCVHEHTKRYGKYPQNKQEILQGSRLPGRVCIPSDVGKKNQKSNGNQPCSIVLGSHNSASLAAALSSIAFLPKDAAKIDPHSPGIVPTFVPPL